jgi:hypothetical protein
VADVLVFGDREQREVGRERLELGLLVLRALRLAGVGGGPDVGAGDERLPDARDGARTSSSRNGRLRYASVRCHTARAKPSCTRSVSPRSASETGGTPPATAVAPAFLASAAMGRR